MPRPFPPPAPAGPVPAAVRESEARYRALAEVSPDAILVNLDGRYVYANRAAARLLDAADAADVVGRSPFEILDPEYHALVRERVRTVVEEGAEAPLVEYRWRRLDGTTVDVEVAAGPITWEGHRAVQVVARDVTRRKRTEAALRESELKYRRLFDSMDEGFVLGEVEFDDEGRACDVAIEEANPTALRITRNPGMAGRLLSRLNVGVDPVLLDQSFGEVVRTGQPVHFERWAGPLQAWHAVHIFPAGEPGSPRVGVLFHDITERRKVAAALLAAKEAAESASRTKSQFLSTISHELRTPLTAVLGFTDLLAGEVIGELNARQKEYLSRIRASAWHLVGIIDEILSFTRSEAGREEVHVNRVDVAEIAREVVSMLTAEAESRGLPLRLTGADSGVVAVTDCGKLRQILLNLVGNALKYTVRGSVEVALAADGDELLLHVRDTGPGIPAERLEDIFEPFYQVDNSSTRHRGGTGLGLAISRRQARLLGGDVTVSSVPGVGSTFTLRLPRRSSEVYA